MGTVRKKHLVVYATNKPEVVINGRARIDYARARALTKESAQTSLRAILYEVYDGKLGKAVIRYYDGDEDRSPHT